MTRLSRAGRRTRGGVFGAGRAVLGRRTKEIVPRLGPSSVPIVDHENLDRVTAETLVESGVRVLVNARRSATGLYPNLGPVILARAPGSTSSTAPERPSSSACARETGSRWSAAASTRTGCSSPPGSTWTSMGPSAA